MIKKSLILVGVYALGVSAALLLTNSLGGLPGRDAYTFSLTVGLLLLSMVAFGAGYFSRAYLELPFLHALSASTLVPLAMAIPAFIRAPVFIAKIFAFEPGAGDTWVPPTHEDLKRLTIALRVVILGVVAVQAALSAGGWWWARRREPKS